MTPESAHAEIVRRTMDCLDMAVESLHQPAYTALERAAAESGASMGMTVTIAWLTEHGLIREPA
jgi:hypothetical protein